MTYEEALAFTHSLPRLGSSPGLLPLAQVMQALGDPQNSRRMYLHVAGTNGKGSVCAMAAAVLGAAGYRVGLFTSPYLVDFRERFQMNGEKIAQETYAALADRVRRAMEQTGAALSQFAFLTAVAFCWFADSPCDIAVLETGVGGRLDATNLLARPLVVAITSISLDHTEWLGDTVEAIAGEKCGILKPGCPAVLAPGQPAGVAAVARRRAAAVGCPLLLPGDPTPGPTAPGETRFSYEGEAYTLSLTGRFQPQNAVTVLAMVKELRRQGWRISQEAVHIGLANAVHPGRCQLLRRDPLLLLDGAHSPGGAAALADTLTDWLGEAKIAGVCGVLGDKPARELAAALGPHLCRLTALTPQNPRALPAARLAPYFAPYCPVQTGQSSPGFWQGLLHNREATVIFGSLYLAGECLAALESDR